MREIVMHPATKLAEINRMAREQGGRLVCVNGAVRIRSALPLVDKAFEAVTMGDYSVAQGYMHCARAAVEGV